MTMLVLVTLHMLKNLISCCQFLNHLASICPPPLAQIQSSSVVIELLAYHAKGRQDRGTMLRTKSTSGTQRHCLRGWREDKKELANNMMYTVFPLM